MTRRRGYAPLELILVFPLLMTLVAMILWIGRAGIQRTDAIADARDGAWKHRQDADPGRPLASRRPPLTGEQSADAAREYYGFRAIGLPGGTATAATTTVFHPWHHGAVEFEELPKAEREIGIHRDVLDKLVAANPGEFTELFRRCERSLGGAAKIDPGK